MRDDDRWQQADRWLERALELPVEERDAFLDGCENADLRRHVRQLLDHAERTDEFLKRPPDEIEALAGEPTSELAAVHDVGHVVATRYRLDERVGQGGMGVVYRARDLKLDRDVAIKFVTGLFADEQRRQRLLLEARAAASLNHPNIVAVHDVGDENDRPFLVMELVAGSTLEESPPTTVDEAVAFARMICSALDHAHSRGVVHRDLKPENVLRPDDGKGPTVKLVDLGVALGRDPRITREGRILGTPAYMAPEQALGKAVDGRADLYSLGIMLYRWTTGRLPFVGSDALAVVSQHIHAPVVPPRSLRPELPARLDSLIVRLLSKDPRKRCADANEVAAALDRQHPDTIEDTPPATSIDGLVRGRMVGRQPQLGQLRDLWNSAANGPRLVLVSGEPGAGKSRLARELTAGVSLEGGRVLWGGCYEYEAATPYLPLVEAIRSWVHGATDGELRQRLGDTAAELSRFAPEIESRLGPFAERSNLSPHEERLRLFDNVARFLASLGAGEGLLIVLDDLQWADQGTLGLLHYLLRQLPGEAVLIVGIYRDVELTGGDPLTRAINEWSRERLCTRLHLARLDRSDTGRMVSTLLGGSPVADEFVQAIFAETDGNPFFVEEVVKSLIEDGQLRRDDDTWELHRSGDLVLSAGIKATVGHRLERVSAECARVLRSAALLGKAFPFDTLTDVVEDTEEGVLDALDEATQAQLIVPGDSDTFSFTHDKIRECLVVEQNPIRVRRQHARIAEALERRRAGDTGVRVEDMAHHFVEARNHPKGLRYADEAAVAAQRLYAHEEALAMYRKARECAEALGARDDVSRVDAKIGDVLVAKGESIAGAGHYERALAAVEDPVRRVELLCDIGEAYVDVGDDRGRARVEEALNSVDVERQPLAAARATQVQGRYHHYRGELRRAVDLLERAWKLAEPVGDPVTSVRIFGYLAGAHQHLADFDKSDRWARRCIEVNREHAGESLGWTLGHEFLAENAVGRGQWREAIEFAEAERSEALRVQAFERVGWADWSRAWGNRGLGRIAEAERLFRETREFAERIDQVRLRIFCTLQWAACQADLGRVDEAYETATVATTEADDRKLQFHRAEARHILAHIHGIRGEWDRVPGLVRQFEQCLEGTDELWSPLAGGAILAEGLFRCGRPAEARRMLDRSLELAEGASARHFEALALRVRSLFSERDGELAAAHADLDRAVDLLERTRSELELGRTLRRRGALHRALTDERAAIADLTLARQLFRSCGVPWNGSSG